MNSNVQPLKASDPTSFGGWKILGRLGEGGFSTIYLGEKNSQLAAIKMIRKELLGDENVFERFATEINNLEKLNHPGIAKFIESDLSTSVPYIAVEYIEGKTLEQRVKEDGPLTESEWLENLQKVAAALDYCHALEITHKDVSPGNIILGNEGPKLIDFGISYRLGDPRVTQVELAVGTPAYMSPDHWLPTVSTSMDLFSLGSTFVFAGTGEPPFGLDSKNRSQTSITMEMPNFHGLTQAQMEIVSPLLFKKAETRPTLQELIGALLEFKQSNSLGKYRKFLRNSSKHLVGQSKVTNSKGIVTIAAAALIFVLLSALIVNGQRDSNLAIEDPSITAIPKPSEPSPANTQVDPAGSTLAATEKNPRSTSAECEELFSAHSEGVIAACLPPANAGDARSNYYLAATYDENGQEAKAEIYYKKAIQLYPDDTKSMVKLVQIYIDSKNDKEYAKWVKICAIYEIRTPSGARCKLLYGMDLMKNEDTKQGIAYLSDAFDWGESSAATFLGVYYNDRENLAKAEYWLIKAASTGDPNGVKTLQDFAYTNQKFDLWKSWTIKSAEDGNIKDMGKIALYSAIKEKDYTLAKKWGLKGGQAGDDVAMFAAGYSFWRGDNDLVNAKLWLTKSANKSNVLATRTLGDIFRLEKNYSVSAAWYEKAANFGDITSAYWGGMTYVGGISDINKGCLLFKKAVSLGDASIKKNGPLTSDEQTAYENSQKNVTDICG